MESPGLEAGRRLDVDTAPKRGLQLRFPLYAARQSVGLAVLLAPYLLGALVLVALPALLSFAIAFTEYDALSPPVWVGLENFARLLDENLFWVAARNSALFVLLSVPLRTLGALGLALLLNQRRRGVGFYRVSVYLPTVIPDVAYALIWLWIFNPIYGPLNQLLVALGVAGPAWLADPDTALLALALMTVFQIGEGFVVLLAGLQDIPGEYYQSAAIDGASRWQLFRFITLPLLAPWLLLLTVRDIILMAQNNFTAAYIMTGGGPYYATLFMPLLIYEEAFDRFRFGLGAAMLVLLFLAVGALLLLVYTMLHRWRFADEH